MVWYILIGITGATLTIVSIILITANITVTALIVFRIYEVTPFLDRIHWNLNITPGMNKQKTSPSEEGCRLHRSCSPIGCMCLDSLQLSWCVLFSTLYVLWLFIAKQTMCNVNTCLIENILQLIEVNLVWSIMTNFNSIYYDLHNSIIFN